MNFVCTHSLVMVDVDVFCVCVLLYSILCSVNVHWLLISVTTVLLYSFFSLAALSLLGLGQLCENPIVRQSIVSVKAIGRCDGAPIVSEGR